MTNKEMMIKIESKRSISIDDCWRWKGAKSSAGYGYVRFNGKYWRVHRLAFFLYKPEEYSDFGLVLHKCNESLCFNPDHLYSGNQSNNILDQVKAGTHVEARKTCCPYGHPYDPKYSGKSRRCKECVEAHRLEYSVLRGTR